MWTLSADRRTVRQQMPPIALAGLPKPVVVHLDFSAETVDAILERLSVLRAQMLPALQRSCSMEPTSSNAPMATKTRRC
jgi:hypothetical protein